MATLGRLAAFSEAPRSELPQFPGFSCCLPTARYPDENPPRIAPLTVDYERARGQTAGLGEGGGKAAVENKPRIAATKGRSPSSGISLIPVFRSTLLYCQP